MDSSMINKCHGGDIWQYPRPFRSDIIDFSVNINPLGISERAKNIIIRNLDKINYYPDPESKYLKDVLGKFHGLPGYNFLIGNGSIELIHLIPRALKPKVILIPIPVFSEYEFVAKANNANCLFLKCSEKDNFKIDVSKLMRSIPKADLVFLCNPNNPTGFVLTSREILSLIKVCKDSKVTLVIDEAFIDFIFQRNKITMISEAVKNKYLLVLRSLTKFFALPGLRIGYLVGHKDIIRQISQYMYPWNISTLAQITAAKVVADKQYIGETRSVILEERAYLYENLNNIRGIKVFPSDANFFLSKLKDAVIKDAAKLSKKLIGGGILIRDCSNFRGLDNRFFRIAVKNRVENIKLISALRAVLA